MIFRRILESFMNAMVHRIHIKTNLGIVLAIMDFVNGMIGNKKESFPEEIQIRHTSFTQEELIAIWMLNMKMTMGTVIAGITSEAKPNAPTGNTAIEMSRAASKDHDRIPNYEIYKENLYAKN